VSGRAASFSRTLDGHGILVLSLDVPGESVNVLGKKLLEELAALVTELEGNLPDVRGVVIASGKPDSFIAGADIKDLGAVRSAQEGETLSRSAQAIFARLAAVARPVVAAIHGPCLGGGLELALSCRYRIASSDSRTVLGVPEVMLGLIPGAGGTQRLPRLVGLAKGLDLVVSGRSLKAERARAIGLVDEVVAPAILLQAARAAARSLADGQLRPRRSGISLGERLARPLIFRKARAAVVAKAGSHYPAPLSAIEAIEKGTAASLESGLALEARLFGELLVSEASRALVTVFFATQAAKKDSGVPDEVEAHPVGKLGVVGAGLMGAGIAGAAAEAGVQVRLKDTTVDALRRGLRSVHDVFEERRRRGSLSSREVGQRLDRISTTTEPSGFKRADLVIEAVFEDLELKRRVLLELESITGDDCVLASNTSSIPIGEIASVARQPARVIGMHFFSPVHRMPLVEIAVTPQADPWATATAAAFARRLGKHVIVVRDGPGFYTTRALAPYLNEAARLVEEGASVESVDVAMTRFGFPIGPLALLDEVGIDVGARVAGVLQRHFGERMSAPVAMAKVVADGRLGRKSGRGFYSYGVRKQVDASLYALMPGEAARRPFEERDIQDRLSFAFLNECVRCLEDGILRSPRDGDVGAIFGLGFPAFLGGPFRCLDHLGPRFTLEVLERLQAAFGERFAPAPLLVRMATNGKSFHETTRA
jgi:3-hydroxyacyl-CoA dehydrogenase/enoyl-CoA hydratase/3-hydroxybutyryl-CoA epimerase